MSIILVPLTILALLLAIPFALVKLTQWEGQPDNPSHIIFAYIDENLRLRVFQSSLVSISFLFSAVFVEVIHDPSRDITLDLAFVGFFISLSVYTYWGFWARNTKELTQTIGFIIALISILSLCYFEMLSFTSSIVIGLLIASYWSFKLFIRKALCLRGNSSE